MTTNRSLPRRLGATLAASAAVLALSAGAASADSIAYVKDGNVWLSTPDASRQYQVTFDGGYSTVSQADTGRIVALRGDRITTLDPQGRPIHVDGTTRYDILTPHSYTHPGTQFRGPFDPVISPNGMKIAYSWYYTQLGETPNCNPSNGCQTTYGRQGTNYISPDGKSPYDKPGWQEQTGWVGPSWTSDGGTIISDPIQVGNEDVVTHTPGDDSAGGGVPGGINRWFFDRAADGMADGEMTGDRTKLAFVTGPAHKELWLYRAKGGYPTVPQNCYRLNDGAGRINSPSWSPDGTTLAFGDDRGVHVLPLPSFETDCGTPTEEHTTRLLIPGARNPDWGPADVPPARPNPQPGGGQGGVQGPQPGGAPGGSTGGQPGGAGGAPGGGGAQPTPARNTANPPQGPAITLRTAATLRTALRKGLYVRVSGARPGTVRVVASSGGTAVARGRAKVGTAGTASVTLRFTRKAKRRLAGKRSVKLVLSAGGLRGAVTLKR